MLFYYNPLNGHLHSEVVYRSYFKHTLFSSEIWRQAYSVTEYRAPAQIKKVKDTNAFLSS